MIFLVSANLLASGWRLREYALARALNKKLFAVVIDPGKSIADLPPELKGTWQAVDETGGQDGVLLQTQLPGSHEEKQGRPQAVEARARQGGARPQILRMAAYQDSLAIRDRLAKADLGNVGWQRDLSVSYNKVGKVQVAQGDLSAALKSYSDSLAIADRLAKTDPGNAGCSAISSFLRATSLTFGLPKGISLTLSLRIWPCGRPAKVSPRPIPATQNGSTVSRYSTKKSATSRSPRAISPPPSILFRQPHHLRPPRQGGSR